MASTSPPYQLEPIVQCCHQDMSYEEQNAHYVPLYIDYFLLRIIS